MPLRHFVAVSFLCAIMAGLLFYPGLGGGFIFDDKPNIVQNPALHITTLDAESLQQAAYSFQPGGGSRALSMLSFALDYWRGGLNAAVFKSTNIAIHALTVIALTGFLRLLFKTVGYSSRKASVWALALAVVWAIHPLQVSSVLYIVQRMQTLGTLFVVLALWAYLAARCAQVDDQPSRTKWVLSALFSGLAFASKEDSALLFLYAGALELTVLNFRASGAGVGRKLRLAYQVILALAVVFYFSVVLPRYWYWESYPGRDFSTFERLITQARVLVMYMGQILLPLPSHMPFFYDDIKPSRGLLEPASTLVCLIVVLCLVLLAWCLRRKFPLFSLGILLFFSAHAITSNVFGLEMAFEHRNSFALIGAVLAVFGCGSLIVGRLGLNPALLASGGVAALIALGCITERRSEIWGAPERFANYSVLVAPNSARAWISLCGYNYELSKGPNGRAYLDKAIDACTQGARIPGSATAAANLVIFKTVRGDVAQADWDAYLQRMRTVTMGVENENTVWVMLGNAGNGVKLDVDGMLSAIDIVARRAGYGVNEYLRIGYFILNNTDRPDDAYQYFALAVEGSAVGDQVVQDLIDDMNASGRSGWAVKLSLLADRGGAMPLAH